MKVINIKVTDQLKVTGIIDGENVLNASTPLKIASGNYKSIILNFEFDSKTWDETKLTKYATFNIDGKEKIQVELEKIDSYNNACYLPYNVAKQNCKVNVGVYGVSIYNGEVNKIVSSENLYFLIIDGSFSAFLTDETPQKIDTIKEKLDEYTNNLIESIDSNALAKINECNNNADTLLKSFNQNASSYNKRITDNSNRISRLETDIFDSGQASGTPINLQDSTLAELIELRIEGGCKQETTIGKNQFNAQAISDKTNISVDDNDVISIFGTASSNGFCSTETTLRELCPNLKVGDVAYLYVETDFEWDNKPGTLKNLIYVGDNWLSGNSKTITESLLNTTVIVYGGYNTTSTLKIMITKDSYDDMFEKYTGSNPSPNPDYPQEIKTITESFKIYSIEDNLFNSYIMETDENDPTKQVKIVVEEDGTIEISENVSINGYANAGKKLKELCPTIREGDTAYLFGTTDFYENETLKNRIYLAGINSNWIFGTSKEITEEMLNSYVIVYGGYSEINHIKLAVSKDKLLASYKPYVSSIVEIQIPENEFAGKFDEIIRDKFRLAFNEDDGKYHLYLDKKIGRKILEGNESWNYQNNVFTTILEDIKSASTYADKGTYLTISNYFSKGQTDYRDAIIDLHIAKIIDSDNPKQIGIKYSEITSVDDFKSLLSNNNIEIYYLLEEPYILDLGVIDMLLSYYPITNIYTDCNLQPIIEVDYYRDFKGTIKIMQDNLTSANMEIDTLKGDVDTLKEQVAQLITSAESEVVE